MIQLAGRVGGWRPRRCPKAGADGLGGLAACATARHARHLCPGQAARIAGGGTAERHLGPRARPPLPAAGAWRCRTIRARRMTPRAPLLVHAVQITRARRSDTAPPLLTTPAQLQVRTDPRMATHALAPAAHLPDLYHLASGAQAAWPGAALVAAARRGRAGRPHALSALRRHGGRA